MNDMMNETISNERESTWNIIQPMLNDIDDDLKAIGRMVPAIEEHNPRLIDEIKNILMWG